MIRKLRRFFSRKTQSERLHDYVMKQAVNETARWKDAERLRYGILTFTSAALALSRITIEDTTSPWFIGTFDEVGAPGVSRVASDMIAVFLVAMAPDPQKDFDEFLLLAEKYLSRLLGAISSELFATARFAGATRARSAATVLLLKRMGEVSRRTTPGKRLRRRA